MFLESSSTAISIKLGLNVYPCSPFLNLMLGLLENVLETL
jgi:hypothetical protein